MKKAIRNIITLGIVVAMLFSVVGFGGCDRWRTFTEEEHLARITERLQARYFYEDGTPRESATFRVPVQSDEGEQDNSSRGFLNITWQYITLERFEVQLIRALDGRKEYFMWQRFPVEMGFRFGMIRNNRYQLFGGERGLNPFDSHEIDIGNRYFAFELDVGLFATRNEKGNLTTLEGHILMQEYIDSRLEFTRSRRGIRAYNGKTRGPVFL